MNFCLSKRLVFFLRIKEFQDNTQKKHYDSIEKKKKQLQKNEIKLCLCVVLNFESFFERFEENDFYFQKQTELEKIRKDEIF